MGLAFQISPLGKSPWAIAVLLKACATSNPRIRNLAAALLRQGGEQAATAKLARLFKSTNLEIVHKAAWAVAALGILKKQTLLNLLREDDEIMRYFAVCARGYLNLQDAHDHMLCVAGQEQKAVKQTTVQSLKNIKQKSASQNTP
ncbi:MAG TPA: hypothetical protein ENN39_10115 [Desulfonatronum sp.]|nr:hypothetical protein [Desulfonatronum sp.]